MTRVSEGIIISEGFNLCLSCALKTVELWLFTLEGGVCGREVRMLLLLMSSGMEHLRTPELFAVWGSWGPCISAASSPGADQPADQPDPGLRVDPRLSSTGGRCGARAAVAAASGPSRIAIWVPGQHCPLQSDNLTRNSRSSDRGHAAGAGAPDSAEGAAAVWCRQQPAGQHIGAVSPAGSECQL